MKDIEEIVSQAGECLNCNNPKCKSKCPLENNIPQMIEKVKERDFEEAFNINTKTNPLRSNLWFSLSS